ncbi:uncharacterized protein PITG_11873 [Phytophthora infestans T30-4]|uniref:Uncharacterized protein n=1 Tax=Phytophthora infestans (strain T30-4) TaxID=403677 RepID=D0NHF7_PHYIT|nr:uncharacterized protein PITG_11873 [Phytophthora infestans T30-4]EEY58882.1 conserved hypothetical protein [Phytophthora infestans T30-4]|eukprot:XP_002901355.1 conserved hypothetical protein [Phytophthora infestans T30-4]
MSAQFIDALMQLVDRVDYGPRTYDLQKIKARIPYSKDRYVLGAFSWARVMNYEAPALVFVGSCDLVAGLPIHVDHGRVISYLPPCAKTAFKIWVVFSPASKTTTSFNYGNKEDSLNRMLRTPGSSVLIQRPGDVVCLNNLVFHSVLLVYQKGTAEEDKWGGIFGEVVVCEVDRVASFRYATKLASGSKKDSVGSWESLLTAYYTMEGRVCDQANFEREKKLFYKKLKLPAKLEKARLGANAKKKKKRKLNEKLAAVRAASTKSDCSTLCS